MNTSLYLFLYQVTHFHHKIDGLVLCIELRHDNSVWMQVDDFDVGFYYFSSTFYFLDDLLIIE